MAEIKKTNSIEHVALIMDGNRRWAKERNLTTPEGHLKGYQKIRPVIEWFNSFGIKTLSFYAFSVENWSRSQDEVNYIMKLLKRALEEDFEDLKNKGYRLIFSGRLEELPGDLPELCLKATIESKSNTKGTVNMCINYGGRTEIIDVIKKMIKNGVTVDQVHEGMIKKYLYNGNLPDPDIIVRTSGEQRLSNFLMWQSVYSEFIFLQKYWPDFEKADIERIIEEYYKRQRNFGV